MPGFVSLVPGFVSGVSAFVCWVLGFVFWVLGVGCLLGSVLAVELFVSLNQYNCF